VGRRGGWFERGSRRFGRSRPSERFADLYASHAHAMLRFFSRQTGDPHRALDLTAETFAKAFEKRGDFRGTTQAQATAWLWAIARNEVALSRRSQATERAAITRLGLERQQLDDEELRQIEQLSAVEETQADVWLSFAQLPREQRQVIELRFLAHMSNQDIAEHLGISAEVVRARVSRGLRALRADQRVVAADHALKR
jgi:RNA polymerase sigma-70 factor (ECF subfamily)